MASSLFSRTRSVSSAPGRLLFVLTTITTSLRDISLRDAFDTAKLVGIGVMFAGAAFIATLFALLDGRGGPARWTSSGGVCLVPAAATIVVAGVGDVGLGVTRPGGRGHWVAVERNEPRAT